MRALFLTLFPLLLASDAPNISPDGQVCRADTDAPPVPPQVASLVSMHGPMLGLCSATWVSMTPDLPPVWLTAKHCVEGSGKVVINTVPPTTAIVVAQHPTRDIAVLAPKVFPPFPPLRLAASVTLQTLYDTSATYWAYGFGCRRNRPLARAYRYVPALEGLEGCLCHGDSGAGVLYQAEGEWLLVGVQTGWRVDTWGITAEGL